MGTATDSTAIAEENIHVCHSSFVESPEVGINGVFPILYLKLD